MWRAEKSVEATGRLDNLKELVKGLAEFENLQGFLEHVALIMDNDQEDAAAKVSVMTLHAAKGLEFPAVFLPGWEDGLFPSQRSMDESGLKGLEEERRLAYVGITRARRLCTISFAANRRVYNQWQSQLPSRFIDELPPAHIEVLTPPGLYGGGFGAAAPGGPGGPTLADTAARADVYNSPGWKRMQARAGTRGMSQPQEARNMVIDTTAVAGLRPRRAGLPPEVRLRHRHRRRGRQAHHRLREGRRQERHRPLRHRRRQRAVLSMHNVCTTHAQHDAASVSSAKKKAGPGPAFTSLSFRLRRRRRSRRPLRGPAAATGRGRPARGRSAQSSSSSVCR